MGCGDSQYEEEFKSDEMQECLKQCAAMKLSKSEVKKLYAVYRQIDVDGGGTISVEELLVYLDLDSTPFTRRIFSIFDHDHSGEVDFQEFILAVWNYCTLTRATLDAFAFDLYDTDGSGQLGTTEVEQMLHEIYGKDRHNKDDHTKLAKGVIQDLKSRDENAEPFRLDHFRTFAAQHQAMLFPAFQMQDTLQRKVMGHQFWRKNAKRRIELSDGQYVSVANFLLITAHKDKQERNKKLHANAGIRAAVVAASVISHAHSHTAAGEEDEGAQKAAASGGGGGGSGGDGQLKQRVHHSTNNNANNNNNPRASGSGSSSNPVSPGTETASPFGDKHFFVEGSPQKPPTHTNSSTSSSLEQPHKGKSHAHASADNNGNSAIKKKDGGGGGGNHNKRTGKEHLADAKNTVGAAVHMKNEAQGTAGGKGKGRGEGEGHHHHHHQNDPRNNTNKNDPHGHHPKRGERSHTVIHAH